MTAAVLTEAHACDRRLGGGHRWDPIPAEYVPDTWFDWVDVDNWRCGRCERIKAVFFDINGDRFLRYKKGTGIVYGDDVEPPDYAALRRQHDARVARIAAQRRTSDRRERKRREEVLPEAA